MSRKKISSSPPPAAATADVSTFRRTRFHLRIGWASLLVFLSLGIGLEFLHAFRAPSYMNVGEAETRRLMWTLAHAHGTLFSIVHIAFGLSLQVASAWISRSRALASLCLTGGGILMPAGFFLGGLFVYDGDPGLGVFLVPPGALLLFIAVASTVVGVWKATADSGH